MSIVGPRPLAVIYLDYYNDEEKKRHFLCLINWGTFQCDLSRKSSPS